MRGTLAALAWLLITGGTANAEIIEKRGTFGGLTVTYKVVLPNGYDPARPYPAVLVFTGGSQTLQGATSTLEADWRQQAERRGYIVVSPGSPNGELFFQGADRIFPEFLDRILSDYNVRDKKLHLAGHSNGGLSAFHVAAMHPRYFSTVTGYPGLRDRRDLPRTDGLKLMCLFMHVGELDSGWKSAMEADARELAKLGYKVRITVEPNQVHRLKAQEIDLSSRLFDEIESCRNWQGN
jgi:predicted peptidase